MLVIAYACACIVIVIGVNLGTLCSVLMHTTRNKQILDDSRFRGAEIKHAIATTQSCITSTSVAIAAGIAQDFGTGLLAFCLHGLWALLAIQTLLNARQALRLLRIITRETDE